MEEKKYVQFRREAVRKRIVQKIQSDGIKERIFEVIYCARDTQLQAQGKRFGHARAAGEGKEDYGLLKKPISSSRLLLGCLRSNFCFSLDLFSGGLPGIFAPDNVGLS